MHSRYGEREKKKMLNYAFSATFFFLSGQRRRRGGGGGRAVDSGAKSAPRERKDPAKSQKIANLMRDFLCLVVSWKTVVLELHIWQFEIYLEGKTK